MPDLHTLWPQDGETFRALVHNHFLERPASGAEPEDWQLVDGDAFDRSTVRVRAVDIEAPVRSVWPWLCQMMRGMGVYGWRLLESPSIQSADYQLAALPRPEPGDQLGEILQLVHVEPGRELRWRGMRPIRVVGVRVEDLELRYVLKARGARGCRLVVRTHVRALEGPELQRMALEVVDFVLAAHQALRIRQYAETYQARVDMDELNIGRCEAHQALEFLPAALSCTPLPT